MQNSGIQPFGPLSQMSGAGPVYGPDQAHSLPPRCVLGLGSKGLVPPPPNPLHQVWAMGPGAAYAQPCMLDSGTNSSVQGPVFSMGLETWQQGKGATNTGYPLPHFWTCGQFCNLDTWEHRLNLACELEIEHPDAEPYRIADSCSKLSMFMYSTQYNENKTHFISRFHSSFFTAEEF